MIHAISVSYLTVSMSPTTAVQQRPGAARATICALSRVTASLKREYLQHVASRKLESFCEYVAPLQNTVGLQNAGDVSQRVSLHPSQTASLCLVNFKSKKCSQTPLISVRFGSGSRFVAKNTATHAQRNLGRQTFNLSAST
jgi:hypothetical protein